VTFLFTDIEGSTRLLQRLGPVYEDVLTEHDHLLRAACARADGRVVDMQGDALFAAFRRANGAVAAALEGQRAFAAGRARGVKLRVRMGLHTGEPASAENRYIGLGVHRAARICAAAHGGQILVSAATHAVLADDPLPDVSFEDLGVHRLKDLERPERLYQLAAPGLPRVFPPPRSQPAAELDPAPAGPRPTHGARLRVVVADDSVLLREGLARLLQEAGFDVVGRAADADALLQHVARQDVDVVVTDIKMPPTHVDEGLAAAAEIRTLFPEVGVLVLSQYVETPYAMQLLESYPGRVGYLLKDRVFDIAVLGDAIRRVAEGECVIDPTIASRLMSRRRARAPSNE
jgi:class 3 adenylate cyclase/DNA-binding NarL/FixJ family response regulator